MSAKAAATIDILIQHSLSNINDNNINYKCYLYNEVNNKINDLFIEQTCIIHGEHEHVNLKIT